MKKQLSIFALCATLLATTACSGDTTAQSATSTDTSANHLSFGSYKYSDSIDPIVNVNASWSGVRYGVTECWFKFDSDVVAQPNLCDTVEHSDDYTAWTIHLLDGLQFSNGNAVTPWRWLPRLHVCTTARATPIPRSICPSPPWWRTTPQAR